MKLTCYRLLLFSYAILFSSLSYSEFVALSNEHLSEISGQAGITIDLETRVTIEDIIYTDEGSLAIEKFVFGGANKQQFFGRYLDLTPSDKLDGLRIEIDVSDEFLMINFGAIPSTNCPHCVGTTPVDFGMSFDSMKYWSQDGMSSSEIIRNFNMTGYLLAGNIAIGSPRGEDEINAKFKVAIDDIDFEIPGIGLEVQDMFIAGSGFLEDRMYGAFDIASSGFITRLRITSKDNYATQDGILNDVMSVEIFGNAGPGSPVEADMGIGNVLLGGRSIGSFEIDNFRLYDTHLHIYGH